MALFKFVAFSVLKMLNDFVSMQKNSLNANKLWWKQNFETAEADITFILNFLSEPSIHFTQFSIVVAKQKF